MDKMQAVVGETLGGPDNYQLVEVERPVPGPKDVQIQVHVSGLGYVDALVAQGLYQVKPDVPYCPGLEFSGVVTEVGVEVSGFSVGDKVVASGFGGGLAEYAVVPAPMVVKLPDAFDMQVAAGFIVNYVTAWHALEDRGALQAGETVLVLGAAGGTGIAAIQVGKMLGAHIIAGASSEEKRAYALENGADAAIDYTDPDWRKHLKALNQGKGVDVVFDPVGADLLEPAFRSLAWRGRYLVIGFAGGEIPALPVNLALLKGSALIGVDYRQFGSVYEPEASLAVRDQLFEAVLGDKLVPPVGATFALNEFNAALTLAAARDGFGKTLVQITS